MSRKFTSTNLMYGESDISGHPSEFTAKAMLAMMNNVLIKFAKVIS
jgi:hypothetical protein